MSTIVLLSINNGLLTWRVNLLNIGSLTWRDNFLNCWVVDVERFWPYFIFFKGRSRVPSYWGFYCRGVEWPPSSLYPPFELVSPYVTPFPPHPRIPLLPLLKRDLDSLIIIKIGSCISIVSKFRLVTLCHRGHRFFFWSQNRSSDFSQMVANFFLFFEMVAV